MVHPLPGDIVKCAQPGRLIIAKPTIWAHILGDMTSLPHQLVKNAALYAKSTRAPRGLSEFLDVCASNHLSLNKYVVSKNTSQEST